MISDVTICLDTTRIYRQAYDTAGAAAGLIEDRAAQRVADIEFDDLTEAVL